LKALILTFSPGEKEPLFRAITDTRRASLLSHSLPLGETHAQAAVRAVFQQSVKRGAPLAPPCPLIASGEDEDEK